MSDYYQAESERHAAFMLGLNNSSAPPVECNYSYMWWKGYIAGQRERLNRLEKAVEAKFSPKREVGK